MAKRFYKEADQGIWEDLDEEDQRVFIETSTRVLIDSPERKLLQKIKDYVNNSEMVEQFAQFGRGGAPMLADVISKSFEGEDDV
jgi:hypothetical protein